MVMILEIVQEVRFLGLIQFYFKEFRENVWYWSLWEEVNGCLGDLGMFVFIVIVFIFVNGFDFGIIFIFIGICNIVIGQID